ncbi:MAG TPA: alpha/beta fold hydrolase [Ilumatobacter sp.]|nr:alpha/beta fold hydrolase [Ilumatobacter sp.]
MTAPETFRYVEVAEGALWCGVGAGDGTPVVFVHGFSVDHAMWDAEVAALARRATTVRYDLRGFGRSGEPHPGYDHVDDLVGLLDRLGLDQAVVVGLSLGANVALALVVQRPERVRGVVLASPGLPGRAWPTPRPPDLALAHARAHGVESARRFWRDLPLFDSTRARPAAFAQLGMMLDRFPAHQWAPGPQSRALPALAELLEQVRRPVTVVSGEHDDDGYLEIAAELAARIPGVRRVDIAAAGHFVNLDEPDAFNEVVAGVLDALDAPGDVPGDGQP